MKPSHISFTVWYLTELGSDWTRHQREPVIKDQHIANVTHCIIRIVCGEPEWDGYSWTYPDCVVSQLLSRLLWAWFWPDESCCDFTSRRRPKRSFFLFPSDRVTDRLLNCPALSGRTASVFFVGHLHPSVCVCEELVMWSGGLGGERSCQAVWPA